MALRLNADAHPPGFLNDKQEDTFWLLEPTLAGGGNASASPAVTLDVGLGDSFQVFFIYVQFYGEFPYTHHRAFARRQRQLRSLAAVQSRVQRSRRVFAKTEAFD